MNHGKRLRKVRQMEVKKGRGECKGDLRVHGCSLTGCDIIQFEDLLSCGLEVVFHLTLHLVQCLKTQDTIQTVTDEIVRKKGTGIRGLKAMEIKGPLYLFLLF